MLNKGMSKYALATVVTRTYCKYFETLLHSYIATNKDRPDWYIYSDDSILPQVLNRWKSIYSNLYMIVPNKGKYAKHKKLNPKFFIFEAFGLESYEKVLCLDADLIIRKDISGLFKMDCAIGMHKETYRTCYNSGVMILGKNILSKGTTDELLKIDTNAGKDKYFGNDQRLINLHFEDNIFEIGYIYNCFANEAVKYPQDDLKIIHYFVKPGSKDYVLRTNEKIRGYYDKIFNEKVKGCTF